MKGRTVEGECPACGTTVRYTGYVPHIFLCLDCGGEKPHADGVYADDQGRLHYEGPDDQLVTDGGRDGYDRGDGHTTWQRAAPGVCASAVVLAITLNIIGQPVVAIGLLGTAIAYVALALAGDMEVDTDV